MTTQPGPWSCVCSMNQSRFARLRAKPFAQTSREGGNGPNGQAAADGYQIRRQRKLANIEFEGRQETLMTLASVTTAR